MSDDISTFHGLRKGMDWHEFCQNMERDQTAQAAFAASMQLSEIAVDSALGLFLAEPTSARLSAALSDPEGLGQALFEDSPDITTPTLTTPEMKDGVTASGSTSNDFSGSTGTFKTSTGANTIGGDVTIAADKDLAMATGDGAVDLSPGTGTFKSNTGANTLGGAVTVAAATTPSITTAAGKTNSGFISLLGKTSGGIKVLPADTSGYLITVTNATQTSGVVTLTLPDFAGVADEPTFKTLAQTMANKTLTTPVIATGLSASGSAANTFAGSTGTFLTSTGLNTIGGKMALKVIATPVAAAGAGGGVAGAAALGSANIVAVSSDGATKGVKFVTGVAGDVIQVINTSATACNLFAASGGTINGGSADAGCAIAASKGVIGICTAADTWYVFDMTAHAGSAA